jgi:hypothetical protein
MQPHARSKKLPTHLAKAKHQIQLENGALFASGR